MTRIKIEAEDHHFFMMFGFMKGMIPKIKLFTPQGAKEMEDFLQDIEPQLEPYKNDKYHPTWEDLK